ncbi:MAG: hypothetical protein RSD40_03690 [Bacilli bacterium]
MELKNLLEIMNRNDVDYKLNGDKVGIAETFRQIDEFILKCSECASLSFPINQTKQSYSNFSKDFLDYDLTCDNLGTCA